MNSLIIWFEICCTRIRWTKVRIPAFLSEELITLIWRHHRQLFLQYLNPIFHNRAQKSFWRFLNKKCFSYMLLFLLWYVVWWYEYLLCLWVLLFSKNIYFIKVCLVLNGISINLIYFYNFHFFYDLSVEIIASIIWLWKWYGIDDKVPSWNWIVQNIT